MTFRYLHNSYGRFQATTMATCMSALRYSLPRSSGITSGNWTFHAGDSSHGGRRPVALNQRFRSRPIHVPRERQNECFYADVSATIRKCTAGRSYRIGHEHFVYDGELLSTTNKSSLHHIAPSEANRANVNPTSCIRSVDT